MESFEHLHIGEGWFPILPEEGLPEGVDSWMKNVPNLGDMFVTLENKPGGTGFEDDNRVYILSSEHPNVLVTGTSLFDQGYRALNVVVTARDDRQEQEIQLGLGGQGASYETLLQRRDKNGPLKIITYWYKVGQIPNFDDLRDVMVSRSQLKDIQVRFPQGGETKQ